MRPIDSHSATEAETEPHPDFAPGDVVFSSRDFAPPVRATVERIVTQGSGMRSAILYARDDAGTMLALDSRTATKLHDARDVEPERLRRLHEAATEETARLRIALEAIAEHLNPRPDGVPLTDLYAVRDIVREVLS